MRRILLIATLFGLVVAGPATSAGFLPDAQKPDMIQILPPSPAEGSPTDLADRAIFRSTRSLKGSPRWLLAKNDVAYATADLLRDFSCAVGVTLTSLNAPRLTALIDRMDVDLFTAVNAPKVKYGRKRPYQVAAGDICVEEQRESLKHNADYPSGHAALSWATGLILAELKPDRATQVLTRAEAFGASRVVCGVHNASSVDAGRLAATALLATLHGQAAFRADVDGARAELAALKAVPPPNAEICAAETSVTSQAAW